MKKTWPCSCSIPEKHQFIMTVTQKEEQGAKRNKYMTEQLSGGVPYYFRLLGLKWRLREVRPLIPKVTQLGTD